MGYVIQFLKYFTEGFLKNGHFSIFDPIWFFLAIWASFGHFFLGGGGDGYPNIFAQKYLGGYQILLIPNLIPIFFYTDSVSVSQKKSSDCP